MTPADSPDPNDHNDSAAPDPGAPPVARQNILDAALARLADGGPAALTVRAVAEAAGCSTMGVYSQFGGKDGLIDAIAIDGFDRFRTALQDSQTEARAQNVSGHAGWHLMAHAYRDWALANPAAYLVMFAPSFPGYEPSDDAEVAAIRAFEVLLGAVTASQNAGDVADGDPVRLAWGMWGVTHGMVMLEVVDMQPPFESSNPRDAYELTVAAMLRGLQKLT